MNKNVFYSKYGLNHNRLKSLFLKYGISDFNAGFKKDKNLGNILNQFLDLYLEKKEVILKKNHLIMLKQINNGSISGYKRLRGLPSHNQRTKTNSRTNRNIKK